MRTHWENGLVGKAMKSILPFVVCLMLSILRLTDLQAQSSGADFHFRQHSPEFTEAVRLMNFTGAGHSVALSPNRISARRYDKWAALLDTHFKPGTEVFGGGIEIYGDNNSNFSFEDIIALADNDAALSVGDNNSDLSITNFTGTTYGDNAAGIRMGDNNSDFTLNGANLTTHGDNSPGVQIGTSATNISLTSVSVQTQGLASHGLSVNTGFNGVAADALTITTAGADADGVNLAGGDSFSLNNSVFDPIEDGDVLDFTDVTTLSGMANSASRFGDFGGALLNDGGGNGPSSAITFDFVDPDGDGVNNGAVSVP